MPVFPTFEKLETLLQKIGMKKLEAGVQLFYPVDPFMNGIGGNTGIEISEAEPNCTLGSIGYKNKIATNINRVTL
ncbi:MAG: hypothetical protein KF862_14235 [Chitinophagaceae bacterium]|nr:hypothetical protein [Chitinophagaceae bacterium]